MFIGKIPAIILNLKSYLLIIMTPLISKLLVILLSSFVLFSLSSPILSASLFLIAKPLIQPISNLRHTLFSSIPLTSLLAISVFFSTAINILTKKDFKIFNTTLSIIYFLTFFSLLSIINTIDYALAIGGIFKLITALSIYILFFNGIKVFNDGKKSLYAISISSLIPIFYGFYQYFSGTGHTLLSNFYKGSRIDSLIGEYNEYGIFLCFCIFATLILFSWPQKRKFKIYVGIILILQISSLILSLNRGSWICLMSGLTISMIFYRRFINFKLVFIVYFAITIISFPIVIKRFNELGSEIAPGISQNTLEVRINSWKELIPLALIEPLTGYGIDNSYLASTKLLKKGIVPHNDYLRVFLETGIFSFIFYISFIFNELLFFIKTRKNKENSFFNFHFLSVIIYFILISSTQNVIFNQILFPYFMALLAIGRKLNLISLEAKQNNH